MQTIHCTGVTAFRVCKENQLDPGESYGERMTTTYELDFITETKGGEMITEGKKQSLKKGMLFFRKPHIKVEGIASYECYFVRFQCSSVQMELPLCIQIEDIEYMTKLFERLYTTYLERGKESLYIIEVTLNEIILQIFMHLNAINELSISEKDVRLHQVMQYIHENLNKKLDLEILAKQSGYSASRFSHVFKETYNKAPMEYVNYQRMSAVCKLLIETDMPIKHIIFDMGFKNEANFFRQFKVFTGSTPQEYRERHTFKGILL